MIRSLFASSRLITTLDLHLNQLERTITKRYSSESLMAAKYADTAQSVPEHKQDDVVGIQSPRLLGFDSGPMVWIDLEMTGLDARTDEIMEIAVLITDGNLTLVDRGVDFVVKVDKEKLDRMDEWCTRQHGSTGLTRACLESPHTLPVVESAVLEYIQKYIPEQRVGVLAGNSVHVDRMFLAQRMPRLLEHLHYRIVDVSSIKELCRRWYNGTTAPPMVPEEKSHRALDDIHGSIKELQWYREHIFVKLESFVGSAASPST